MTSSVPAITWPRAAGRNRLQTTDASSENGSAFIPLGGCKVLWWVCPFVCLSARITQKPHGRTSSDFLCMLPVAVARSSPDGLAIRYVLPVLRITSSFHTTGPVGQNQARHCLEEFAARWTSLRHLYSVWLSSGSQFNPCTLCDATHFYRHNGRSYAVDREAAS